MLLKYVMFSIIVLNVKDINTLISTYITKKLKEYLTKECLAFHYLSYKECRDPMDFCDQGKQCVE